MTVLTRVHSALLKTWFRLHGVSIGDRCMLAPGAAVETGFRDSRKGVVVLGNGIHLARGAHLNAWGGEIRVGNDVFIGDHAVVYGHGGVEIGQSTLISMHCRILSSNHAIAPVGTDIRSQPDTLLHTRIGRDVWIGAGVTILGGVTLGDGCIIGAGAVVAADIPPNAIALGVPARVARMRPGAA